MGQEREMADILYSVFSWVDFPH